MNASQRVLLDNQDRGNPGDPSTGRHISTSQQSSGMDILHHGDGSSSSRNNFLIGRVFRSSSNLTEDISHVIEPGYFPDYIRNNTYALDETSSSQRLHLVLTIRLW